VPIKNEPQADASASDPAEAAHGKLARAVPFHLTV
jgi:hypothetical protein